SAAGGPCPLRGSRAAGSLRCSFVGAEAGMAAETRRWWMVALAAGACLGAAAVACGGDGGGDRPEGRTIDPGAFLAALETEVCRAAAACANGGEGALAGCGVVIGLG